MDYTDAAPIGIISQSGNFLRVDNALVEEVFTSNGRTGYILISYGIQDQYYITQINLLRLNVGWDTVIINQFGEASNLYDIRKGMRIDAEFSSAMTRSIPPQSRAFRIIVRTAETAVNVTTDRVVGTDVNNGFLYTGNPYDISDQMRFVISNATIILDRNGNQIRLRAIRPGELVRVEHAIFQTLSIPPQTTAFRVQLL
jgi:hypothetical protein